MLTLPIIIEAKGVALRGLNREGQPRRIFYYTNRSFEEFNALPTGKWERGRFKLGPKDSVEALVEDFIARPSRDDLIRPNGQGMGGDPNGMGPPFKRMWAPDEAVVEMRTEKTRTFGFFHRENVFVACSVWLTDVLKKQPGESLALERQRYRAAAESTRDLIVRLKDSEVDMRNVEELVTHAL